MAGVIVVGTHWGDEGKGKIIDLLAKSAQHVVRAQGGNNAGHTIVTGGQEYKLHLIPSGIFYPHTTCYIGAGTVLDPAVLCGELVQLQGQQIQLKGRLWISPLAHVILPYHRKQDDILEVRKGKEAVGTTRRGIGPCYADKIHRQGIRIIDLINSKRLREILTVRIAMYNEDVGQISIGDELKLEEIYEEYHQYAERLKLFVADVETKVYDALKKKETVLFEGAQGTFLDITFGTYPYVTSSSTIAAGICGGAGIGPTMIDYVVGVVKAYTTRVGQGPMPTEVKPGEEFLDYTTAREYGTTTGRRRRIGWLDAFLLKEAVRLNGLSALAVTKLDILDHLRSIKICVGYEMDGKKATMTDFYENGGKIVPVYEEMPGWETPTSECTEYDKLPPNARRYIERMESLAGVPVDIVSVGAARDQTMIRRSLPLVKENA